MEPGAPLILIPARNEAARIPKVIAAIREHVPQAQILVIEDGSKDDTVAVVRRLGARIVSLPVNLGYGGALRVGYQYAVSKGYQYVVSIDADGQHDPADMPTFLAKLAEGQADLVVGSRFLGKAHYKIPLARRLGMFLFSSITSAVVGRKISDTTCGFLAVGPRALPIVARDCAVDFPNAELICIVARHGRRVEEVPVNIREREDGQSMFTFWTSLYYPFKLLLAISMIFVRNER